MKVVYGEEQITLGRGDSVYLRAAIPHSIAPAAAGRSARVLSVSYGADG